MTGSLEDLAAVQMGVKLLTNLSSPPPSSGPVLARPDLPSFTYPVDAKYAFILRQMGMDSSTMLEVPLDGSSLVPSHPFTCVFLLLGTRGFDAVRPPTQ